MPYLYLIKQVEQVRGREDEARYHRAGGRNCLAMARRLAARS